MNKTNSLKSALVKVMVEAKKAKVGQLKEQFNAIKVEKIQVMNEAEEAINRAHDHFEASVAEIENVFRKTLKQLS